MPRDDLFDLAVNRAYRYLDRTGQPARDAQAVHRALEIWYLKTRFAYRIPLDAVIVALLSRPDEGRRWRGGESGGWLADPGTPPN